MLAETVSRGNFLYDRNRETYRQLYSPSRQCSLPPRCIRSRTRNFGIGAGLRQQRGLDQHEKQGAIERVFSVESGQSAIESIITRYAITGKSLRASWDARVHEAAGSSYVALRLDGPLKILKPRVPATPGSLSEEVDCGVLAEGQPFATLGDRPPLLNRVVIGFCSSRQLCATVLEWVQNLFRFPLKPSNHVL